MASMTPPGVLAVPRRLAMVEPLEGLAFVDSPAAIRRISCEIVSVTSPAGRRTDPDTTGGDIDDFTRL
jgi:hypothetical protein